jgi:hypothetical protein
VIEEQKKSHGCLFWGGLTAGVLLLMALLAGYAAYRFARGIVDEYTDTTPIAIPAVKLSKEETTLVRERIEAFSKARDERKETGPLTLTGDEINALIVQQGSSKLKRRFFVTIEEDRIKAQLSVPAEELGMSLLRGRYFNGSGEFLLSLHDGFLRINVKSLAVKGKPLPESFMKDLRHRNFADHWDDDEDPALRNMLRNIEEIEVRNGVLTIVPKKPEPVQPAPAEAPVAEQPAATNAGQQK